MQRPVLGWQKLEASACWHAPPSDPASAFHWGGTCGSWSYRAPWPPPTTSPKPALDIGQGSLEGELTLPDLAARVPESEPLHPVGIWLVSGECGPLVSHLVPFDALVAWALSDLDFDSWLFRLEGGDVFPGHDCVFLAWSRIVGGHFQMAAWVSVKLMTVPSADGAERMFSACRYTEGGPLQSLCILRRRHPIWVLWPFQVSPFFQATA